MELLKVEGLKKNYGGLQVLRDVSFSLGIGERVAIIGPNGAGKSTAINVLSGLIPPTAGTVELMGRAITNMPMSRRVGLGMARSFQTNTLFANLTLLENVMLAVQGTKRSYLYLRKSLRAQRDTFQRAQQLLERVSLWEKRDTYISCLSHGEQREVEIVLALASKPQLVLLDEPNAGLSQAETRKIEDVIRDLPGDTTVLFSGHDMEMIFGLADRVMVLFYGEVMAQGTPREIQADPQVRKIYLGEGEYRGA